MIVHALRIWRHYLVGRKFELKIDHHGLQHIFTQRNLNARKRRWLELLSEFDFDITYIKGTVNRVANALSHGPRIFSVIPLKTNLRENILILHFEDEWYKEVKFDIENKVMQIPKYAGYALDDDGFLRFNERIYIPPNEEM
jgi:hypothetical protein